MNRAQRQKLASDLWGAHLLLAHGEADERVWAIDKAVRLLAGHESLRWALDYVEEARCGDAVALDGLAESLDIVRTIMERPKPVRPRSPRKPSVRKLIQQAEESGKPVSSVTTPDGVTLHFGTTESAGNEWDEVLPRHGTH
jgi:hypothetical protein